MLEKYALFKILKGMADLKEHSIPELARTLDVGRSTAKLHLDWLYSKGMVTKRSVGRTFLYSTRLENFLARYAKIFLSLRELLESGVAAELADKYPDICSIVLYGSVSRGEDDSKSDIDILIITRKKIRLMPLKAEKRLGREITFIAYTLEEWRKKAREDKIFYDNVLIDGIVLYGTMPTVI